MNKMLVTSWMELAEVEGLFKESELSIFLCIVLCTILCILRTVIMITIMISDTRKL